MRPRVNMVAFDRYGRYATGSVSSIGSVGLVIWNQSVRFPEPPIRFGRFGNFAGFSIFRHVGELEICLVSNFQFCATLGVRKNVEKPKHEFSEFSGSVGSVFRSVRSMMGPRVVEDRSGYDSNGQQEISDPKSTTRKRLKS